MHHLVKGLKQLLVLAERGDEEIAAEEVGGDVVALIDASAWRVVTVIPGLPAYLLDEAERGGTAAVTAARGQVRHRAGPSGLIMRARG